jgi:hypothetical protein
MAGIASGDAEYFLALAMLDFIASTYLSAISVPGRMVVDVALRQDIVQVASTLQACGEVANIA